MMSQSRFAVDGFVNAVMVTAQNGLLVALDMVDGFTNGLSEGFYKAGDLAREFSRVFEKEISRGFAEARRIALVIMGDEDKWEAAGEAAAEAFMRGIAAIETRMAQRGVESQWGPGATSRGAGTFPMDDEAWNNLVNFQKKYQGNTDQFMADFNTQWNRAMALQSNPNMQSVVFRNVVPEPPRPMSPIMQTLSMSPLQKLAQAGQNARIGSGSIVIDARGRVVPNTRPNTQQHAAAGSGMVGMDSFAADFARVQAQQDLMFPNRMHSGGFVGKLGSDEVPAILQAGEYVIQKSAVSSLGTGLLNSINNASATFASPASRSLSMGDRSAAGSSETVYNLSFNIDGGNIDESKLAQKVVFEIKKMERSSGGGRRVSV